ncbi:MAG: hypothetical protein KME52_28465 [Desmonostoc geniculatum HA4340-LM1]|jgi:hypothetical protein|nr:hypothetical protein [Desmonostoc geniculatum HA4340-LM1]
MRLEFRPIEISDRRTFIFTEYGIEIIHDSNTIPEPRTVEFIGTDGLPLGTPRQFLFTSYRSFVGFTIAEPYKRMFRIELFGRGVNSSSMKLEIKCSEQELEELKTLLIEKISTA